MIKSKLVCESIRYELIKYLFINEVDKTFNINNKNIDRYLSSVLIIEFSLCENLSSKLNTKCEELKAEGCNKCWDYVFNILSERFDLANP
jgi:hypothetical protein